MKLHEVKNSLNSLKQINFKLEDGTSVPSHFHITEVGKVTKHFIDCGGTERKEEVVNFQLWSANDTDHRLAPEKVLSIIELSEKKLGIQNLEVEVEYQAETIGKFALDFNGKDFILTSKQTDCLAKDNCGIPAEKPKLILSELESGNSCTPGGGCC